MRHFIDWGCLAVPPPHPSNKKLVAKAVSAKQRSIFIGKPPPRIYVDIPEWIALVSRRRLPVSKTFQTHFSYFFILAVISLFPNPRNQRVGGHVMEWWSMRTFPFGHYWVFLKVFIKILLVFHHLFVCEHLQRSFVQRSLCYLQK